MTESDMPPWEREKERLAQCDTSSTDKGAPSTTDKGAPSTTGKGAPSTDKDVWSEEPGWAWKEAEVRSLGRKSVEENRPQNLNTGEELPEQDVPPDPFTTDSQG